ncbi:MAG: type II secretion system GspH family protein [Firmicutes bacterium]|nr:type II secretion system GspH family protein [Bacillota bacterium]
MKQNQGFFLIELIVASMILLILVLAFTSLLTGSFTGIFRAGRKSQDLYYAQELIDKAILDGTTSEQELKITINGTLHTVLGEKVIVGEDEGLDVTITTFLPKR